MEKGTGRQRDGEATSQVGTPRALPALPVGGLGRWRPGKPGPLLLLLLGTLEEGLHVPEFG